MPCVRGLLASVASEGDLERLVERGSDALEGVEVEVAGAALETTDDHPAEPCSIGELNAGPGPPLAERLDLRADPGALLLVAAVDLHVE